MTTYMTYPTYTHTNAFSLADLHETRRMWVVKAAKLGVEWAKVHLYRDTPEWRAYANTLPCGMQDAKGEEQDCRYNDYLRAGHVIARIDESLKDYGFNPAKGLADDILESVNTIIDAIFREDCHHDTFNMVLDSHSATLVRLPN